MSPTRVVQLSYLPTDENHLPPSVARADWRVTSRSSAPRTSCRRIDLVTQAFRSTTTGSRGRHENTRLMMDPSAIIAAALTGGAAAKATDTATTAVLDAYRGLRSALRAHLPSAYQHLV